MTYCCCCGTWRARIRAHKFRPPIFAAQPDISSSCDGTFAESLATAKNIHKRAVETVGEIPVMLIVNKSDLWGRWQITMPELEKMQAEGWNIQVTSAKTGEGVEKMFLTMTEHVLKNNAPSEEDDTEP